MSAYFGTSVVDHATYILGQVRCSLDFQYGIIMAWTGVALTAVRVGSLQEEPPEITLISSVSGYNTIESMCQSSHFL